MRVSQIVIAAVLVAGAGRANAVVSADARRGEKLFAAQSCDQCHSIDGKGGRVGPDLGKSIGRDYTPASLTARMWNHAPAMWSTMQQRELKVQPLTDQDAADLFAFFYSVRFFDKPADAARGKRLFESKRCAECHGISESKSGGGKPVSEWQSLSHPIELTAAMWNHAANMRQAFSSKGIPWPSLTGQEISDILIYVRNLPATRGKIAEFKTTGENGKALFESKGCVGCHAGKLALGPRLTGKTLSDIAAAMWSHAASMGPKLPSLDAPEMSQIVTFLWTQQVTGSEGNPAAGKKVFASSRCESCHAQSGGAPNLASRKGSFSSVAMVSSLWQHGPQMLKTMNQKNVQWPRLTPSQMSDLIAYLNAGR